MVFNNNLLLGAAGQGGGYTIDQSIRFNSADSAYLNRTPASAGDRQKWTFNCWLKLSELNQNNSILSAGNTTYYTVIRIDANNQLVFYIDDSAGYYVYTTQVFRDVSAWYCLTVVFDTTQATSSNRVKFYINGVQITAFSSLAYPVQNYNGQINNNVSHAIGRREASASAYFGGYLTEINFIDGQALTPTDFGEYNSDGVWIPKAYSGSYGTNGFYITGEDSADLGADYSGNGNDFTSSGLTSDDQVSDTPTDDVENNIGNYAVLSPIDKSSLFTTSNGNTRVVVSGSTGGDIIRSTQSFSSGKFAAQFTITDKGAGGNADVGVVGVTEKVVNTSGFNGIGQLATGYSYLPNGQKMNNGSLTAYGASYTNGDRIECEFDRDAGTITFFKNGISQGTAFTGVTSGTFAFAVGFGAGSARSIDVTVNFGATAFTSYTPTTGFNRLITANLPAPTIADPSAYFQTTLYTGNGTAIGSGGKEVNQSGNSTFQPDFVWIKNRDAADNHMLYDAVRGATKDLHSNATDAEATDTEGLSTFDADGFTVGSNVEVNTNTENYVAWQWKANGSGSSNTDGSITSTASADTTSGFSIVSYTGTGTAATVGHGLGVAPAMIIVKNRDAADAWQVYHKANTAAPETDYLVLNTTAATADATDRWNDTAPTSTVFSIGNGVEVNTNTEDYIAYCFAEVEGFSKFGKYTGNGSTNGSFVWCGFRPAFVMTKRSDSTGNWTMFDNQREGYNVNNDELVANTTAAETTTDYIDILSNGFKLRSSDADVNASNGTYIFMAFSEHPFGGSGVAPVNAR